MPPVTREFLNIQDAEAELERQKESVRIVNAQLAAAQSPDGFAQGTSEYADWLRRAKSSQAIAEREIGRARSWIQHYKRRRQELLDKSDPVEDRIKEASYEASDAIKALKMENADLKLEIIAIRAQISQSH